MHLLSCVSLMQKKKKKSLYLTTELLLIYATNLLSTNSEPWSWETRVEKTKPLAPERLAGGEKEPAVALSWVFMGAGRRGGPSASVGVRI